MNIVCAECRKPFVQAVRRQGFLDRLLSLAYTYPFRCQVCGHRFRLTQWGLRYIETAVDRREYRRRPVRLHAKLLDEEGKEYEGTALDLSMGGCAIETHAPLHEGDLLSVHLDAFDREPPIIVETAIVRSAQGTRLGLEFLRFSPKEEERVSQYMLILWVEGTEVARRSR